MNCLGGEQDAPSLGVLLKQPEHLPQGLHNYYLVLRSLPTHSFFILPSALITQIVLIDKDVPMDGWRGQEKL